jgi:uncharacterized membrane-anchored protein YitT (DUF2179 family)
MIKHTFSIGLNDQHTKKQIYTSKQAQQRIIAQLQKHRSITGYTIHTAKGGYTHADGTTTQENSLILELFDKLPRKTITQLANDIKDTLNQETIVYTKQRTKGVFI